MTEILHHFYLNWQNGIRVGDFGVILICSLTGSSGEACWLAVVRSGRWVWVATAVGVMADETKKECMREVGCGALLLFKQRCI